MGVKSCSEEGRLQEELLGPTWTMHPLSSSYNVIWKEAPKTYANKAPLGLVSRTAQGWGGAHGATQKT